MVDVTVQICGILIPWEGLQRLTVGTQGTILTLYLTPSALFTNCHRSQHLEDPGNKQA